MLESRSKTRGGVLLLDNGQRLLRLGGIFGEGEHLASDVMGEGLQGIVGSSVL